MTNLTPLPFIVVTPYPLKTGVIGAHLQAYQDQYEADGLDPIFFRINWRESKWSSDFRWLYLFLRYGFLANVRFAIHQHISTASGLGILPFLILCRLFRKPVLVISHERIITFLQILPIPIKPFYILYEHAVFWLATHYVVHNRVHASDLEKQSQKKPVHIIPLPIANVCRERGLHDGWGFYGMLAKRKGIDILVEAYQSVEAGTLPILWIMGGPAPKAESFYQDLKSSIKPEFQSWIRFTGFVKEDDKAELFSRVHLMIFPYRFISQSGAMAETCVHRIPYLASDLPFFKEFNQDFGCGILFKSEDVENLRNKLLELAKAPLKVPESDFSRMEEELSIKRCAYKMEKLLGLKN